MGKKGRGGDKNPSSIKGNIVFWDPAAFIPQSSNSENNSAWSNSGSSFSVSGSLVFDTDLQGRTEMYLPLYIYNDGVSDLEPVSPTQSFTDNTPFSAKYIILSFEDDGSGIGFSQETYVLKEAWDEILVSKEKELEIFGEIYPYSGVDPTKLEEEKIVTLINETNYPNAVPKLVSGSSITEAVVFIEDAQTPITQLGDNRDVFGGSDASDNVYAGGGDDDIYAGDGINFIRGEAGDDRLFGGVEDDALFGDNGNDILSDANSGNEGGYGHDYLNGGSGDDVIYGGDDQDVIDGMMGDDILYGDKSFDGTENAGTDIIYGGAGNDTIYGGAGYGDIIYGDSGNDIIYAGKGDDNQEGVNGGTGNDLIYGEAGSDHLFGDEGNDIIDGGEGQDSLNGGDGFDIASYQSSSSSEIGIAADLKTQQVIFRDSSPAETLSSIEGVIGSIGDDYISGTDGDDFLDGSGGSDILAGGTGNDTYVVDQLTDQINDAPQTGIETVQSSITWTLQPGLDHLILTGTSTINGIGNNVRNHLTGNSANNYLFGGEEDDILDGSAGDDTLEGGTGNDLYRVDSSRDTIVDTPQTGIETVEASASWSLISGLDNLTLIGTEAIQGTGNDLPNVMIGNSADNVLNGGAGDDTLSGGAGNDQFNAGVGNDTITGNAGSDRFHFSDPAQDGIDSITDFNVGEDKIGIYIGANNPSSSYRAAGLTINSVIRADQFQVGTAAVSANNRFIYNNSTGALFFDGDGTGAQSQTQVAILTPGLGLSSSDIFAFDGSNTPIAFTNNASTNNSGGIDNGSAGNDQITGSPKNDTIVGLGGDDMLDGGQGNDQIESGAGNDFVKGGAGNDKLFSGRGNDRLKGGGGRDIFALEKGMGVDTILDFKNGQDRLGLTNGMKFKQLKIRSIGGRERIAGRGHHTLISFKGDQLAVLMNVKTDLISAVDFVKI